MTGTLFAIDSSLSKCAVTISVRGSIVHKEVIKTGSSNNKKKLKSVRYLETTEEQIHFICERLRVLIFDYNPSKFIFESLSFGSTGNASRDLASLYGGMVETILSDGYTIDDIIKFAPTSLKAFMRTLLPVEEQTYTNANGKVCKVPMKDKKLVVRAATLNTPEGYFDGYKYSGENAGLDDLADSWGLLKLYESTLGG